MSKKTSQKEVARKNRKSRIVKKLKLQLDRPRLIIYRSNSHIYAQIVDPRTGHVLASASTLSLSKNGVDARGNKAGAVLVGEEIAKIALSKDIKSVIFDRNGYLYHGNITVLADSARAQGLDF
ncbi:MAG: 50S ribosomal protein L18 [Desulfovibrionaceae bacterium]|nr:50S ribosomal protein L18 [Desulfovibrionaceae bacterium]